VDTCAHLNEGCGVTDKDGDPVCGPPTDWHRFDCPLRLLDAETWSAVQSSNMLEAYGSLPESGGWLDQSAWLIAALGEINAEKARQADRKRKARH